MSLLVLLQFYSQRNGRFAAAVIKKSGQPSSWTLLLCVRYCFLLFLFQVHYGIQSSLSSLDYERPDSAKIFTEAIGILVTDKPDIILLDIQLIKEKDGA